MRPCPYLLATAMIAMTSIPASAIEMAIGDSAMVVYGDAYAGTAHDAAYGNPYGGSYISSEEVIFVEEAATMEIAPVDALPMKTALVKAEYFAAPEDFLTYSLEAVEAIYSADGIVDETVMEQAQVY